MYQQVLNKTLLSQYKNGYCFYDDRSYRKTKINKLQELQSIFPDFITITKAEGLIEVRDGVLKIRGKLYISYDETKHKLILD